MELLTKTEEKVMHILWHIKKGFVKDIIEQLPSPKPPYNTISSVVRILEQKGMVDHKAYGKTYEYFPSVSKTAYKKFTFKRMMQDYFDNSMEEIVSFIVREEKLTKEDEKEILKILEKGRLPKK